MSLFSRLFSAFKEHLTEKRCREIAEQAKKDIEPVGEISLAIIKAVTSVCDVVKVITKEEIEDEDLRAAKEMEVFYQFVYFMRAVTMQAGYMSLRRSQLDRLSDWLDPSLASTAIGSFFPNVGSKHFPEEMREGLIRDFFEGNAEAEMEFAECAKVDSGKQGEERLTEMFWAVSLKTVGNISSILSATNRHYNTIMGAAEKAVEDNLGDIVRAIEEIAERDLPAVDSRAMLRHLMTTQS